MFKARLSESQAVCFIKDTLLSQDLSLLSNINGLQASCCGNLTEFCRATFALVFYTFSLTYFLGASIVCVFLLFKVAPYCSALTSLAFNYSLPDSVAENLLLQTNKSLSVNKVASK